MALVKTTSFYFDIFVSINPATFKYFLLKDNDLIVFKNKKYLRRSQKQLKIYEAKKIQYKNLQKKVDYLKATWTEVSASEDIFQTVFNKSRNPF
jgi:hypothetical protein